MKSKKKSIRRRVHGETNTETAEIMLGNDIATKIIGCAIEIHKTLGPGLLESAYRDCLFYDLQGQGLIVEKERVLPILYKELRIDHGYRG